MLLLVPLIQVLLGTNQDEAATFVYDGVPRLPEALFRPLMGAIFGKDGPKVRNPDPCCTRLPSQGRVHHIKAAKALPPVRVCVHVLC